MRKIIIVLLAFFVCSCSTFFNTPNDTPNDSEAMTELKNELAGVDFMEYFDFRYLPYYSVEAVYKSLDAAAMLGEYVHVSDDDTIFHNVFAVIKYYQNFDEYEENPEYVEEAVSIFINGEDGFDNYFSPMLSGNVFSAYAGSYARNRISDTYYSYQQIQKEASPFGEFYTDVLFNSYKEALGYYVAANLAGSLSEEEKAIISSFGITPEYLENNCENYLDTYFRSHYAPNIFERVEEVYVHTGLKFSLDISVIYDVVEDYIQDLLYSTEENFSKIWDNRGYPINLYSELKALGGDGKLYESLIATAQTAFKFEIDNAQSIEEIHEIQSKSAYVQLGMEEYAQSAIDAIYTRNVVEYEGKYNELLSVIYGEVTPSAERYSEVINACIEFFNIFNSGKEMDDASKWKEFPFITEKTMKDVSDIYDNNVKALDLLNWMSSERYSFIIDSIPSEFIDAPLYIGHNGIAYKNTDTTLRECISSHNLKDIELIITPTGYFDDKILIEQFFESFSWSWGKNIRYELSMTVSIDAQGNAVIESASDDTQLIYYSENYKDIEYVFNKVFSGSAEDEYMADLIWYSLFNS